MTTLDDDFLFDDLKEKESKLDSIKNRVKIDDLLDGDLETDLNTENTTTLVETTDTLNGAKRVEGLPKKVVVEKEEGTEIDKSKKDDKSEEIIKKMEVAFNVTFSDEQRKIIKHTGSPLNVLSSAGSGKTTILVAKMLYREMMYGEKPLHMLAITFTSKARYEMEERYVELRKKLKLKRQALPTFRTFHALFLMLMQSMSKYSKVKILDGNIYRNRLSNMVVSGVDTEKSKVLDEMFGFRGNLINQGISKDGIEGAELNYQKSFLFKIDNYIKIMEHYNRFKKEDGYIDFDDMQLIIHEEIKEKGNREPIEAFRRVWGDGSVYIDEYQDISSIQRDIMDELILDFNRFTVIGDDDQCWHEDTEVNTLDGVKKIKDVKVGDYVKTVKRNKVVYEEVKYVTEPMMKETLKIYTKSGKEIEVTQDHKVFASLSLKAGRHYVILHNELSNKKGNKDSNKDGNKYKLKVLEGRNIKEEILVGDAWVLRDYESKEYAQEYKEYLDVKYPDIEKEGYKLLHLLGQNLEFPHYYTPLESTKGLTNNVITLVMNSQEGNTLNVLEKGLNKVTGTDYVKVRKYADGLVEGNKSLRLKERYLIGTQQLEVMPASHLFEGMKIPVVKGQEQFLDEVVRIDKGNAKKKVYHLEVKDTGILVANDVVTHNSIYSWRGSAPKYIIDFPYHYKGAERLKLSVNYRCKENILKAIKPSIEMNEFRVDKDIKAFNKGGVVEMLPIGDSYLPLIEKLIDEVDGYEGEMYKEIAVLVRQNSQRTIIADALIERDIPVNIGHEGNSLQSTTQYKTFMEVIEMIKEEDNKLFVKHARKIVPQMNSVLINSYNITEDSWYEDICEKGKYNVQEDTIVLIEKIKRTNNMYNCIVLTWKLLNRYYKHITSKGYGSMTRVVENVKYLMEITKGVSVTEFEETEYRKRSKIRLWIGSDEAIKIDTLHSVKGLEFETVYLIGVDNNILPDMNRVNNMMKEQGLGAAKDYVEEERRLFYVGWTRAKERLFVSYNKNKPSIFLNEIELDSE